MDYYWNIICKYLLDLDVIPIEANFSDLILGWSRPLEVWVWSLLCICAALIAVWSYSKLSGNKRIRLTLSVLRMTTLMGLVALFSGPVLIYPVEQVDHDIAIVLLDRSESMTIRDIASGEGTISRNDALRNIINNNREVWDTISKQHELVWLGFDRSLYDIQRTDDALSEPIGTKTDFKASFKELYNRYFMQPLSGIILLSDGQTSQPISRAEMQYLNSNAVPLFTIPIGSKELIGDVSINEVNAPHEAYIFDTIPIQVHLDYQATNKDIHPPFRIRLYEGDNLITETLIGKEKSLDTPVTLLVKPINSGIVSWRIQVETMSNHMDLLTQNNTETLSLRIIDRSLRVLYIEGYPRWEYRYLKNLLIRDQTIDSSIVLISADHEFAQEGDSPVTRLPNDEDEFAQYDLFILGDFYSGYLSSKQWDMMRNAISEGGAGVLWIAGQHSNPYSFAETSVEGLLPINDVRSLLSLDANSLSMNPTPEANRLGLLNIRNTKGDSAWPALNNASSTWSDLKWVLSINKDNLKVTTKVLATAQANNNTNMIRWPVVLQMRYGAGQSIFVATDDIWRWRYARGEFIYDQFWIQLIYSLSRDKLKSDTHRNPISISIVPDSLSLGESVFIEASISTSVNMDIKANVLKLNLYYHNSEADNGEVNTHNRVSEIYLTKSGINRYSSNFTPDKIGMYSAHSDVLGRLDYYQAQDTETRFMVNDPASEWNNTNANYKYLEELAELTGGRVLSQDELSLLPQILPNRTKRIQMDISESIWDTPLCMFAIIFLLSTEWIGRRLIRYI